MTLATANSVQTEALAAQDLTGRDRIAWNVLVSWCGQLVFVAAGFLMPRLIDAHLGQRMLGVWDLCWSIVTTVGYSSIHISASTNRYVSKYRAVRDVVGVRRATSSVFFVELALASVAALLTALAALFLPMLAHEPLGADRYLAAGLVALLGASICIQVALEVFRGVITGCHRWDLHNAINSGSYAVIVAGMVAALWFHGGLLSLATVYLAGAVATEVFRAVVAYRVCPELRIRWAYADWTQARSMVKFGGKSFLEALAGVILGTGGSLLIAGYLGPSALAVFARPAGLVRQAANFVAKFAHVLTPTASALHGSGRKDELRQFLIVTTRLSTCLAVPSMLFLVVMGGPILRLWMGPRYEEGLLVAVVAGLTLPSLVQSSSMTILMGMNMHGRMALLLNAMALSGLALGAVALGPLAWGLVPAAVVMAAPMVVGHGIVLPIYTCRSVGVPFRDYVRLGFGAPVACTIPFGICLMVARLGFGEQPLAAILLGGALGTLVTAPLYWRYVLPTSVKRQVTGTVARWSGFAATAGPEGPVARVDRR